MLLRGQSAVAVPMACNARTCRIGLLLLTWKVERLASAYRCLIVPTQIDEKNSDVTEKSCVGLRVVEGAKSGEPFSGMIESQFGVPRVKLETGENKRDHLRPVALAAQCLINGECLGRPGMRLGEVAIDVTDRRE